MSQKTYIFLCLISLLVISGCIEFPQTQAEKVGWNQPKYEAYSAYYDILRPPPGKVVNKSEYDMISEGKTIDEWIISIPKDKNELENTWYLVFYYIKKGQDVPLDTSPCPVNRDSTMNPDVRNAPLASGDCQSARQKSRMNTANVSYSKAAEYRQKIEDIKMNLSR